MKKYLFTTLLIYLITVSIQAQTFQPVPANLQAVYRFDFQKNFFKKEDERLLEQEVLIKKIIALDQEINKKKIKAKQWPGLLHAYDQLEKDYRVFDLYYFLQFAINTQSYAPLETADSLRNQMLSVRGGLVEQVAILQRSDLQRLQEEFPAYRYFFQEQKIKANHQLDAGQSAALAPFRYLTNSRFYDEALKKMEFEKVQTPSGSIDVIEQRGYWENHPDPVIQDRAEATLIAGYATQKNQLAASYLQYIKGLDAFAKAKKNAGLIDEKLAAIHLDKTWLERCFKQIQQQAVLRASSTTVGTNEVRFDIVKATEILNEALSVLGADYAAATKALMDPENGRIDLVGGSDRVPIRGTASVYPIPQSIFYAQNYEGYLLDLTLLAHELGHAVQADLMYKASFLLVDTLITQAQALLEKGDYPAAEVAYKQAIAAHPDHFFLYDALAHINYVKMKTPAQLRAQYESAAGSYEDRQFWVEEGHLYYKRTAMEQAFFPQLELLPISETRYFNFSKPHLNQAFQYEGKRSVSSFSWLFNPKESSWAPNSLEGDLKRKNTLLQ